MENALPMPFDRKNEEVALVLRSSDVERALNHESLTVTSVPSGSYQLKIDGKSVGTFTEADFAKGIDLAALDTPMIHQAEQVRDLTWQIGAIRYDGWRTYEFSLQDMPSKERDDAINGIARLERALTARRHKLAQPTPHRFEIVKAG